MYNIREYSQSFSPDPSANTLVLLTPAVTSLESLILVTRFTFKVGGDSATEATYTVVSTPPSVSGLLNIYSSTSARVIHATVSRSSASPTCCGNAPASSSPPNRRPPDDMRDHDFLRSVCCRLGWLLWYFVVLGLA